MSFLPELVHLNASFHGTIGSILQNEMNWFIGTKPQTATSSEERKRMYVCSLTSLEVGNVIFIWNDGMTIRCIVFVDFFISCSFDRLICEELTILITEWND